MSFSKKDHWEKIYITKAFNDVSWYQPKPEISLDFIQSVNFPKEFPIIDIGGGDSFLSDNLIKDGYGDVTVLDISQNSIERAKKRQKESSYKVNWIVSDILEFVPKKKYSIWHDRAVFHFLRERKDIEIYINTLVDSLSENGRLILGTFAENGPNRCCSLDVTRYSFEDFESLLSDKFSILRKENTIHITPFNTEQSFNFIEAIKK